MSFSPPEILKLSKSPYFNLGCISKWHLIKKGRALNEEEVDNI
jgi:hypothetical protein